MSVNGVSSGDPNSDALKRQQEEAAKKADKSQSNGAELGSADDSALDAPSPDAGDLDPKLVEAIKEHSKPADAKEKEVTKPGLNPDKKKATELKKQAGDARGSDELDLKKSDKEWGKSGASKVGDSFDLKGGDFGKEGAKGKVTASYDSSELKDFDKTGGVKKLEEKLKGFNGKNREFKNFLKVALESAGVADANSYVDRKAGNEYGSAGAVMSKDGSGVEIKIDEDGKKYFEVGYQGEGSSRKYAKVELSKLAEAKEKLAPLLVNKNKDLSESSKVVLNAAKEAKADSVLSDSVKEYLQAKGSFALVEGKLDDIQALENGKSLKLSEDNDLTITKLNDELYYSEFGTNLVGKLNSDNKELYLLGKDASGAYNKSDKIDAYSIIAGKSGDNLIPGLLYQKDADGNPANYFKFDPASNEYKNTPKKDFVDLLQKYKDMNSSFIQLADSSKKLAAEVFNDSDVVDIPKFGGPSSLTEKATDIQKEDEALAKMGLKPRSSDSSL